MRLGLSSNTYPWAIGLPGNTPTLPMSAEDLVRRAHELDVRVVQFTDNLPLESMPKRQLESLRALAQELSISIEVGTRGIVAKSLLHNARLAELLGAPFVRVALDNGRGHPLPDSVERTLRQLGGALRARGIKLAIENHDRLPVQQLAALVRSLGSWVGVSLDTVNSMSALNSPEEVIRTLAPLAISVRVKDFAIVRAAHRLGFVIEGRAVGDGMLDVELLLRSITHSDVNAIIEVWTPPANGIAATVEREADWAERSVRYLRTVHRLS